MRYTVLNKNIVYFENYGLVSFDVFDTDKNEFLEFSFVVSKNRIEQFKIRKLPEVRTERYKGIILTEDSFIVLLSKLEQLAKKAEAERDKYLNNLYNP